MSIPEITPYPMPDESQLPAAVTGWQPCPGRAALLVHDMQGHFLSFFPPGHSPVVPLVSNIARLRTLAGDLGMPVFYTVQPGRMTRTERGLLRDIWGPGMTDEPAGREVVPDLTPSTGDVVVTKYRYSGFHRTTLAGHLAALGRDQLIVTGVFAHLGCLFTAADAFAHDIQPFLVADAVADFSLRDHLMAVRHAARCCAQPTTTDRLAARLTSARGAAPAPRARPGSRSRASGRCAGGGN